MCQCERVVASAARTRQDGTIRIHKLELLDDIQVPRRMNVSKATLYSPPPLNFLIEMWSLVESCESRTNLGLSQPSAEAEAGDRSRRPGGPQPWNEGAEVSVSSSPPIRRAARTPTLFIQPSQKSEPLLELSRWVQVHLSHTFTISIRFLHFTHISSQQFRTVYALLLANSFLGITFSSRRRHTLIKISTGLSITVSMNTYPSLLDKQFIH